MASPQPTPRRYVLETIWQGRVDQARQAFEEQPSDEARESLQRSLHILSDLILRGKLPPADRR